MSDMDSMTPAAQMERIVQLMRLLREPAPVADGHPLATKIMDAVYELGMALRREPSLREAPEFQRFIAESTELLTHPFVSMPLWFWPAQRESYIRGRWEGEDWRLYCELRSSMEFLREVYRDTPYVETLEKIGFEDFDADAREWGRREGGLKDEEIPDDMPASHWWWWYPSPPRP